MQSAECGVKGKKPNSWAGGGQNQGDATVAHLAGGLVRRALLERPTAGNRDSGAGNPPSFRKARTTASEAKCPVGTLGRA